MPTPEVTAKKRAWRRQWKQRFPRPAELTRAYSEAICRLVGETAEFRSAPQVAIFHPFDWEIDLLALWKARPGHCYFPRVEPAARRMEFFRVERLEELQLGFYDIKEPPALSARAASPWTETDLVLCPGLYFDRKGGRLGGGLGLYDRFLAGLGSTRWAVCGTDQILDEEVALDATDVRMDALCTEKGWIRS